MRDINQKFSPEKFSEKIFYYHYELMQMIIYFVHDLYTLEMVK